MSDPVPGHVTNSQAGALSTSAEASSGAPANQTEIPPFAAKPNPAENSQDDTPSPSEALLVNKANVTPQAQNLSDSGEIPGATYSKCDIMECFTSLFNGFVSYFGLFLDM